MKVDWSDEALDDLDSIRAFIAKDDPTAARRTVLRILDAVESLLTDHPEIGRPGRVPGTRELVISRTPYIVPYRLQRDVLQVLRVYHGVRKWPDRF